MIKEMLDKIKECTRTNVKRQMVGLSKRNSCIESFAAGCSHQSWSWPRGVLCRKRIDQKRWKEVRRIVTLEMKKHRSNMGEGGIIWSFCREKFIWSQQRILLDVCPWVETEGVSKRRMRRKKLMREGRKRFCAYSCDNHQIIIWWTVLIEHHIFLLWSSSCENRREKKDEAEKSWWEGVGGS